MTPTPFPSRTQSGFTLIELLFVISLLVIMSAIAYTGAMELTTSGAYAEDEVDRLIKLQKTQRLMETDLEQLVPRATRDAYGDIMPPMVAGSDGLPRIEFTRGGLRNPQGLERSSLQRIAWAVDDGKLVRFRWNVLDRAQDSEPTRVEVLDGVEDIRIRLLDAKREWKEQWPEDPFADPVSLDLPRGVELTLTLERIGEIRWLFQGVE